MLVIFSLILSACSLPFTKSQKAALDIKSDPVASVYINDDHVGTTPFYKDDLKPGEFTVKLVPEANPQTSWQTKVTLKPQLLTNITRSFGASEDASSHFTLTLEKLSQSDQAQITIISQPDSAVVKLDGQPEGFAPVELSNVSPGDHQVSVSSPGYKPITIPIKAIAGLRLTISTKLAKDKNAISNPVSDAPASPSAQISPTLEPSPASKPATTKSASSSAALVKPYITIKETPTGWLRVRSEPSGTSDNEIARVDQGKSFPFIKTSNGGWYQIEYEIGKQGWISSQYATLVQ